MHSNVSLSHGHPRSFAHAILPTDPTKFRTLASCLLTAATSLTSPTGDANTNSRIFWFTIASTARSPSSSRGSTCLLKTSGASSTKRSRIGTRAASRSSRRRTRASRLVIVIVMNAGSSSSERSRSRARPADGDEPSARRAASARAVALFFSAPISAASASFSASSASMRLSASSRLAGAPARGDPPAVVARSLFLCRGGAIASPWGDGGAASPVVTRGRSPAASKPYIRSCESADLSRILSSISSER